jgi:hypothetical protein
MPDVDALSRFARPQRCQVVSCGNGDERGEAGISALIPLRLSRASLLWPRPSVESYQVINYSLLIMDELERARAVSDVLGDCKWSGAVLAKAMVMLKAGATEDKCARHIFQSGFFTLRKALEIVPRLLHDGFTPFIEKRFKIGSAENPVTKLFPAAVTERQFLDELDRLHEARKSVDYVDRRFSGHSLVDFAITEEGLAVPVNVKNAGTRFNNALALVGLDPNDCIPIPAYKAFDAVEKEPNLVYVISIDYALISKIQGNLLSALVAGEAEVWRLLNEFAGQGIRKAEDRFVYETVNKHWEDFSLHVRLPVFRVISARKSIRILQRHPQRTPGLGLRAWGTGANAEVNVHISVQSETKEWTEIHQRMQTFGLQNVIGAINRQITETVYDPEI